MEDAGSRGITLEDPLLPLRPSQQPQYTSLIRFMYAGHFLARWGARMWEFSVGLYMINIWPDSLLFAALYGVVESASTALFGSVIGSLVDRLSYVKVLRLWLLTQNLSFIVAGVSVTALLSFPGLMVTNFTGFLLLVLVTNAAGATGVLSTLAGTILIEREWVVVISNDQPDNVLTSMNSVIRRIDLTCKLVAPVLTGIIISFISLKASAVVLALWNTISVWLEFWLLKSVYNGIPALSLSCQRRRIQNLPPDFVESSPVTGESVYVSHEASDLESRSDLITKCINTLSKLPCIAAWITYLKQDVVLPGVALSLLYFTVLSFGTLMTATLEWKGIPAYIIGLARGVSAIIGISATISYPILHSYISTLRTGLWSIWTQWGFLLLCVASVWVRSDVASAWLLMFGVATSRIGLWMFDLSVMQQMQDLVPESDRCIVGGVQNSLQSFLDLLTYVMGIIISNPQDFGQLVVLSFVSVSVAAMLYSFYIYRVRKHLFHFDKLFAKLSKWYTYHQESQPT